MTRYALGIDPGDSTGICIMDFDTGEVKYMGILKAEEMPGFFRERKAHKFAVAIYEDFILYRNKAQKQTGSRFKASQVIGQLKMWCDDNSIRIVRQPASVLTNGYKAAGLQRKSDHAKSHDYDAFIHTWVFLSGIGKIK